MGKRRAPKQCSMPREIKQPRLVPPEPVVPIIPILPIIAVNTALIAHVFFMMQDFIIVEFLAHCDLLTLMTLAKSSRYARDTVKSFFSSNVGRLVEFFVSDDHIKAFYETLKDSCGGIGGSVATSVLSFPYRHSWLPSNLNIFVPSGGLHLWRQFFDKIKLAEHKIQLGVSRRYRHTTKAHVVFLSVVEGFTIEISESRDSSILTPVIGATSTLATNLITCSDFYVFYPFLLRNLRALEGWFLTPVRKAVTMGRRGYSSSFSTGSWNKPCGVNCPVKWRYIKGLEGVGIFRWGGYLNAQADNTLDGIPETDNHVKWCLGDTCTNRECRLNKGNYFTLAHHSD